MLSTRERCGTSTPFGLPVVPDVYGIVNVPHSSTSGGTPGLRRSDPVLVLVLDHDDPLDAVDIRAGELLGAVGVDEQHACFRVRADRGDFRRRELRIHGRERNAGLRRTDHGLEVLDRILRDDRAVVAAAEPAVVAQRRGHAIDAVDELAVGSRRLAVPARDLGGIAPRGGADADGHRQVLKRERQVGHAVTTPAT